jgi:large subunit ribosomal protein L15
MMKVHDLKPAEGSTHTKKRKGRGIAGKSGKTAGRGHKGQKARGTVPAGFEGGQLPLQVRLPKLRGFKNPFRVEYQGINLDTIVEHKLTDVSPETLTEAGLLHKGALVKILGRGGTRTSLTVKAHAFSNSAEEAITNAGGSIEKLPLPFSVRPPSSGNQHMNR